MRSSLDPRSWFAALMATSAGKRAPTPGSPAGCRTYLKQQQVMLAVMLVWHH